MYLRNTDEVVKKLINELGFWESWAVPFVRANGKCVYCDEDLLSNPGAYAGAVVDHLFPKSRYPAYENDPENWVLSCPACNASKGSNE